MNKKQSKSWEELKKEFHENWQKAKEYLKKDIEALHRQHKAEKAAKRKVRKIKREAQKAKIKTYLKSNKRKVFRVAAASTGMFIMGVAVGAAIVSQD